MTNKPMLSVEREIIEDALAAVSSSNDSNWSSRLKEKLRALLDKEVEEFKLEGWSIDRSAGRPILMHNNCSVIEAEQAYGLLELIHAAQHRGEIDLTPERLAHAENVIEQQNSVIASLRADLVESYRIDSKHQGEPVAYMGERDGELRLVAIGCFYDRNPPFGVWIKDHEMAKANNLIPLYAEQPAPVAVVMPERRAIHAAWDHAYNRALDDVARLNGVNP